MQQPLDFGLKTAPPTTLLATVQEEIMDRGILQKLGELAGSVRIMFPLELLPHQFQLPPQIAIVGERQRPRPVVGFIHFLGFFHRIRRGAGGGRKTLTNRRNHWASAGIAAAMTIARAAIAQGHPAVVRSQSIVISR